MKKGWKYALLVAGAALTVAFVIYGGRLLSVRQDPSKAFVPKSTAPPAPSQTGTSPPEEISASATVRPSPEGQLAGSRPDDEFDVEVDPDDLPGNETAGETNEPEPVEPDVSAVPEDVFETSAGNIVALTLLGIDTTPDRAKKKMGWRSDSIAVCVIDLAKKYATVISVPRDTRTKIQRLDSKGRVIGTRMDKINAAYAYGGGAKKYSHQNALQAVSNLLGIKLRYYASIDMDSIGPLADSMGGVELTLEETVPGIGKKGETVLLKGDKAFLYVRKRKGITGGSDIARTKRQQVFLKAAAMKLKKMGAIESIPVLLASLGGRVRTNLSLEQMLAMATVLRDMDTDDFHFVTLPGKGRTIDGTSYYIVDKGAVTSIVRRAISQGEQEAAG